MANTIVLAYSGGLDTSIIVPWLKENYGGARVICVAADIGQGIGELEGVRAKALASGADECYVEDLREEFIADFVYPTLRAGAVYNRKYLLGTSMARPLIARRQVEVARRVGATALAHGCTGKGNDQVRFELTYAAFAPDLPVIAPWREWNIRSREDALAYAAARNIPVAASREKIYSRDANIWHLSHEGGVLEDPNMPPPDDLLMLTNPVTRAPDVPETVVIEFAAGTPVAVNGEPLEPIELLSVLNAIGGRHGVGVIDLVEDRMVGMKSRGIYETPGGSLLYAAHSELEQLVLDRRTLSAKDLIAPRYADLVYEGRWWTTEREAYDAFVQVTQERVTGTVSLRLYKGSIAVAGRASIHALYDERFVTFGEDDVYQQSDAAGFIRLFALPARVRALKDQEMNAADIAPRRGRGGTAVHHIQRRIEKAGALHRVTAVSADQATPPTPSPPPSRTEHKLWGGRFAGGPAKAFEALNNSIGVDFRLWPHDIRLSKAWAMALYGANVLTLDECQALESGLGAVGRRLMAGEQPRESDEDVHTLIDRLLHEEAGDVASRLHTGRSRNDQVATATRLWTMDAVTLLDDAVRALQLVMLDQATALEREHAVMPGYTHLQRAIPVSAAHWLLSHFWPLDRDRARLRAARAAASSLPLGSGALAGCAYPISRVLLQGSLGFSSVAPNSIDAVSDRDFVAELIFTCAMTATHLSRFAEDLIIYGTSEFGFVRFGDAFTSGSSMMPQKRNPDALELARGSAARVLGDLTTMIATLKGLPSSYNKDLQDDKRVLFDAVDTLLAVLPAVAGALGECRFDAGRMRAALSSTMMATDLADYLVRKGATFREAHGAVGRLVRLAEEQQVELGALPLAAFTETHPLVGDDVRDALSPDRSVALRDVVGGTGPAAVQEQLEAARQTVADRPRSTPTATAAV